MTSPQETIETTVAARAEHRSKDAVSDTRSFGNMEQTLTREYWGRFLIELLQNARDAWLASGRTDEDGVLRIRLTDEPALIVCNEGVPITPEIVLESIGKFGESSKSYGAGIGHKGIGFKSVLEVSLTPEVYSRSQADGDFDLCVRFDPDAARQMVLERSPAWTELVADLVSAGKDAGRGDRIPTLRFPLWIDEQPASVVDAARVDGRAFDTIVRLPHDGRFEERLSVDRNEFVERVRTAINELTDEIILFLGTFGTILIEDEIDPARSVRLERTVGSKRVVAGGGTVTTVGIRRNAASSSSWWLYERNAGELPGLEGDLALALRVAESGPRTVPLAPKTPTRMSSGDTFHLFFPTHIQTHLPFVPHAYFQVDAGRKGFAADSAQRNQMLLDALRGLAIDAIHDLGAEHDAGRFDLTALADLFALASGTPEDSLANAFRDTLLEALDSEPWVTAARLSDAPSRVAPVDVLAEPRGELAATLPVAIPGPYLLARANLRYPHPGIERSGLSFLAARAARARGLPDEGLDAATLAQLLTPGDLSIWLESHDVAFKALLESLAELDAIDPAAADVIETLRGDPKARVIPVIAANDPEERVLRAPPAQREGGVTSEGRDAILARIRAESSIPLAPPDALGIDFLPDGVVDAELLGSIGSRLGIQPFNTASVLDALAKRGKSAEPAAVARFAWRLLLREDLSGYSVAAAVRKSGSMAPEEWFWARPGAAGNEVETDRRRRERALGSIMLPTQGGSWRPATELAFGATWADWVDRGAGGIIGDGALRASAYRDLESLAPSQDALLAGPDALLRLLPLDESDLHWLDGDNAPALPEEPDDRHASLAFAFLLRLGVWEVPPLAATVDYQNRSEESRDAWQHLPGRDEHRASLATLDAKFAAYDHSAIHVGEDYRFAWPVEASDALTRSLGNAVEILKACQRLRLFCPKCRTHNTRYASDGEPSHESYLFWQVRAVAWIPVTLGGTVATSATPERAWDEIDRPDAGRISQSWQRFLPLVAPDFDPELGALVGVRRVDNAGPRRIHRLLAELQERFDAGEIEPERRSGSHAGQAFAGLHWRLYERLAKADPNDAASYLSKIGSLATLGTKLGYHDPATVRHDDGAASALKRHFTALVPFSVLTQEKGSVAGALGIRSLRLVIKRRTEGEEIDVTDQVRPFLHERAADFLALQVYHPLAGAPLELGSQAFVERANRLESLRVVQLENLVLNVQVEGTDISIVVGAERDQDLYLAGASTSKPVLYHDLMTHQEERLRALIPAYLAELLESQAYSPMFRLLLQQQTDVQRLELLDEYGVTEADVERVAERVVQGGRAARGAETRWWQCLLPLLGSAAPATKDAAEFDRAVRARLEDAGLMGAGSLGEVLVNSGGGEAVRRDVDADGVLAQLESWGVDLAVLDERLRAAGDAGLTIGVAARALAAWLQLHGRELTAVLLHRGRDEEAARESVRDLRVVADLEHRVTVGPRDYLGAVIDLLRTVGLEPDVEVLAAGNAADHLASLVGLSAADLDRVWASHYSVEERALVLRENALAWRRTIMPVLVASRTPSGAPAHRIRAERDVIDGELPASAQSSADVAVAVLQVLPEQPSLAEALASAIDAWPPLSGPDKDVVNEIALQYLAQPDHLERVQRTLNRGARRRTDAVRGEINAMKASGVTPKPFEGIKEPPPEPDPRPRPKAKQVGPRRRHDQRVLDRLGMDAEKWVRASVLAELLELDREGFVRAVGEMRALLQEVSTGKIVDDLVRYADEALTEGADDDDRLDALAAFVHVAAASDDFGFDLLGWTEAYPGSTRRAMLLEVKSSADRGFIVSTAEWRRAQELRDVYAFLIVLRSSDGAPPRGMELLPDPDGLHQAGLLPRDPDGWRVRYAPAQET